MEIWTIGAALIGLIIAFILFRIFLLLRARKRIVVSALIDIYGSGSSHVEFVPDKGVHPVDLIQLAISYIANLIFLTVQESPGLKPDFIKLIDLIEKHDALADIAAYRLELNDLARKPSDSLLSTSAFATGKSERYQVRLIRGVNMDYSLSEFSMYGYTPNLTASGVFLYNAVANRVNDSYLFLLHKSLLHLVGYFHEVEQPTMNNNQSTAFSMVGDIFRYSPVPLENSPGRVRRKL